MAEITPQNTTKPMPGRTFTNENIEKIQPIFQDKDYHVIKDLIQYCKDNNIRKQTIQLLIKRIVTKDCYNDYYHNKIEEIMIGAGLTPLGFQGLTDVLTTAEISIIESIIKQKSSKDLLIDPISTDREIQVDRIKNVVELKHAKIVNKKDMYNNLYVGTAIHKTYIDLNEKGTKAAAVTFFGMKDIMAPIEEEKEVINIKFNKPFIYIIRDAETKEMLFFGAVFEPNKWNGTTCRNEK